MAKRSLWTKSEDEYLIANARKTAKQVATQLGRGVADVQLRRRELGIRMYRKWKPEYDEYLKANPSKTNPEIASDLGVSNSLVRDRRLSLGLIRKARLWSEGDDAYLIRYKDSPMKFLAEKLGRTEHSIYKRKQILGLISNGWSESDLAYLRSNAYKPVTALARHLGRKPSGVISKLKELGIKPAGMSESVWTGSDQTAKRAAFIAIMKAREVEVGFYQDYLTDMQRLVKYYVKAVNEQ